MRNVEIVHTAGDLASIVCSVPADTPLYFLYGDENVGIIRVALPARALISVPREGAADEVPIEDVIHGHDGHDWHGHSYADYLAHPAMGEEHFPPE